MPSSFLTNKAVFCKTTSVGNITSAIAAIREITPLPIAESQNKILANIAFGKDDLEPVSEVTHSFNGYNAVGLREAFLLLPDDKQKTLVKELLDLSSAPENLIDYKIENAAFVNYYYSKPLTIKATIKAPNLLDKAGNKYLLNVGEIIGRQKELYEVQERKLPVDMAYPHSLNRQIVINIPAGYTISNLQGIKIATEFKNNEGKVTMGFKSDYILDHNILTITINEWYEQLHCEVKGYDMFRKVINATADFNKVVLLLAKE